MFGNKPGQRIIEVDETDSTNSYAARLLHDSFPEEGTVIFSRFQKAGRGQRGSNWESDHDKNLLLSYILYPTFLPLSQQFVLNQAIALGLMETLGQLTSIRVSIKWPNDILAEGEKIAGILIENSIRSEKIIQSVAGAGININQRQFNEYNVPATSLSLLEGKSFETLHVLKLLNKSIDKWYTQVKLGNYDLVRETYLKNLFMYKKLSRYESGGIRFNGTITGVGTDGRLEISREDGTVSYFGNKEIKFLFR